MGRDIQFNRVERILQGLESPIARASAASQLADVTLILADGEANLGELIAASANELFESPDDMRLGLHNALPYAAVGPPNQSDSDS